MMAVMSIGRLTTPIISISKAASAATELFVTIDAEVPDTSGLSDPDVSADADIRLEEVSFSYPTRPDVQILDKLNLHFEAGKVTAIVGPSGSGKSTTVALLERWYPLVERQPMPLDQSDDERPEAPDSEAANGDKQDKTSNQPIQVEDEKDFLAKKCIGTIFVGNVDLRKVDLKWWRAQIGLVQQEPFLFNDTIYNNVAYGLCGTKWEDKTKEEKLEMIKDACVEAHADEFISKLPQVRICYYRYRHCKHTHTIFRVMILLLGKAESRCPEVKDNASPLPEA